MFLLFLACAQHRHLELHHEQLNLTPVDKLRQSLQQSVLGQLLSRKQQSLGRQIADGSVEHLKREQLLYKRVVFKQRCLQRADHAILVDQTTLP